MEVNLPYTYLHPTAGGRQSRIGDVELAVKFANFAFAEQNLLLGSGVEFGLPTGNDQAGIGSDDIVDVEPYLAFGYYLHPQVQALLEFDGQWMLDGEEAGVWMANLTPVLKFRPLWNLHWITGVGVGFPLADSGAFDSRAIVSTFYHF